MPVTKEKPSRFKQLQEALMARKMKEIAEAKDPSFQSDWRSMTRAGSGAMPTKKEYAAREQDVYKEESLRQTKTPPWAGTQAKAIMEGLKLHREALHTAGGKKMEEHLIKRGKS